MKRGTKKTWPPTDMSKMSIIFTREEINFLHGRIEIEQEWGDDVYDKKEQAMMATIQKKLSGEHEGPFYVKTGSAKGLPYWGPHEAMEEIFRQRKLLEKSPYITGYAKYAVVWDELHNLGFFADEASCARYLTYLEKVRPDISWSKENLKVFQIKEDGIFATCRVGITPYGVAFELGKYGPNGEYRYPDHDCHLAVVLSDKEAEFLYSYIQKNKGWHKDKTDERGLRRIGVCLKVAGLKRGRII